VSPRVRLLLLVAGVVVIAIMVERTGPALLLEMLRRVGWHVLTVVALYALHVSLRAVALWRSIVFRAARFSDVLRVRLEGEAVEVLTSTGPFLAGPSQGKLLMNAGVPPADAFGAVVSEYLLYTGVSAVLALVACGLLIAGGQMAPLLRTMTVAMGGLMAAFLVGMLFAMVSGIGLIVPAVRASGALFGYARARRAVELLEPMERVVLDFLHGRPARVAEVAAIEIAGHALLIAEIWVVLTALGIGFTLQTLVTIEGGAKPVGLAFFFIPGQLGALEVVYTALFRAVGLSASVGLTLALVRRVRSLCVAAIGLLALALLERR